MTLSQHHLSPKCRLRHFDGKRSAVDGVASSYRRRPAGRAACVRDARSFWLLRSGERRRLLSPPSGGRRRPRLRPPSHQRPAKTQPCAVPRAAAPAAMADSPRASPGDGRCGRTGPQDHEHRDQRHGIGGEHRGRYPRGQVPGGRVQRIVRRRVALAHNAAPVTETAIAKLAARDRAGNDSSLVAPCG